MQERPLGITILGVLNLLGGAGMALVLWSSGGEIADAQALAGIGMSPQLVLTGMIFLAILDLLVAIGFLFVDAPWGWWCGAFSSVYALARNASALIIIILFFDDPEPATRGIGYYVAKHAGRLLFNGLILYYLCRPAIREYFDLPDLKPWKAVGVLIGIVGAISAAATGLNWLLL